MKAVGYKRPLPISDPDSLLDIDLPVPVPSGHDLLVSVKAVSVNPVDVKERAGRKPSDSVHTEDGYRILGFDAAGVVEAVGRDVTLFKPGDEVWYAGSIVRQGTNAEFHLIDERIAGPKPRTLDFSQAAALPLTTITAWELLFDRLGVEIGKPVNAGSMLIVGGSGGVGSILTQLARRLTGLTIVSTGSGPNATKRSLELGAHFVVDHTKPFAPQMKAIGVPQVEYIASLVATDKNFAGLIEVLAPQGRVGVIDDPNTLDVTPLKKKAASLHWELMFTRSMFETPDMIAQHNLLTEVSRLVDDGIIRTTFGAELGPINANNLKRAHQLVESGGSHGKIVLSGF